MRETKPIALVRCYRGHPENEVQRGIMIKQVESKLKGYNVLITFDTDKAKDVVEIQVFNGDDITYTQFKELKRIVNESN